MRFAFQKLVLLAVASVSLFAACHAFAAPDAPRALTPTVDIDVEDRGLDKTAHVARFSMTILDGKAQISARDGEAHYDIDTRTQPATEPLITIKLRRTEPKNSGDIDILVGVPQKPGARVLVAKIDRADGQTTSVMAQVR